VFLNSVEGSGEDALERKLSNRNIIEKSDENRQKEKSVRCIKSGAELAR
jgi:hypothetical protein